MPPAPFTLDFEASCLPHHGRSYPIEVGVTAPDGETRSWLIRPEGQWSEWTWSPEAERIHGISREDLARQGRPAAEVLAELTAFIGRQPVVADSYLDESWMRTLEAAAGAPPLVRVVHIQSLIDRWKVQDDAILRALAATDVLPYRRHRAGEDARRLQALVQHLAPTEAPVAAPARVAA